VSYTERCPYCNARCDADWCDVGVGEIQCGPFHCNRCGASEIGPYDEYVNPFRQRILPDGRDLNKGRVLTQEESDKGWYAPESMPGSSANVIDGNVVSHSVMKDTYQDEFKGNPLWNDKSYVDDWYKKTRGAK